MKKKINQIVYNNQYDFWRSDTGTSILILNKSHH